MSSYRTAAVSLFGLWPAESGRGEQSVISSPIKRYASCTMAPPRNYDRLSEQRSLVAGSGIAGETVLGGGGGGCSRGLIKDFGGLRRLRDEGIRCGWRLGKE